MAAMESMPPRANMVLLLSSHVEGTSHIEIGGKCIEKSHVWKPHYKGTCFYSCDKRKCMEEKPSFGRVHRIHVGFGTAFKAAQKQGCLVKDIYPFFLEFYLFRT